MALGTSWATGTWDLAPQAWANGTWADKSTWVSFNFIGGTAFSQDGRMGTLFVNDATPVPSPPTAVTRNGFAHTQAGKRYIALWPADNKISYNAGGGVAVRQDGAMIIAAPGATKAEDANGMSLTFRGEVIVAEATPNFVDDARGLLYDGTLCVSNRS